MNKIGQGLDCPRCIGVIIHCKKWSRHCGATSPPYRTPLNRWTTKPAKPGHGQSCRGCYMVWTHRSLDIYRWHHPKHHSSPQYPFAHPPPPFEEKVKKILYTSNVQSRGGQGQRLSWRQRGRPQPRVPQGL